MTTLKNHLIHTAMECAPLFGLLGTVGGLAICLPERLYHLGLISRKDHMRLTPNLREVKG